MKKKTAKKPKSRRKGTVKDLAVKGAGKAKGGTLIPTVSTKAWIEVPAQRWIDVPSINKPY